MGRTVNVGAILDFDCLLQVGNQPPKLLFDIIFGDRPVTVEDGVEGHLVFEIALLEVGRLLLELLQRIQPTFLETELAVADKTSGAVPLVFWFDLDGWIEASAVVAMVAGLAGKDEAAFFAAFAALLTPLLLSQKNMSLDEGWGDLRPG